VLNGHRFTSVHGRLGLVTILLIVVQFLVGVAQFYFPTLLFGSVDKAKSIYKYHRMAGYVILVMALATVAAATQTPFIKNVYHIKLWAVLVASGLILAGILPRVKKAKFGL